MTARLEDLYIKYPLAETSLNALGNLPEANTPKMVGLYHLKSLLIFTADLCGCIFTE
jgi:hypothetical protein